MRYLLDLDTGTGTPGADHDDGLALGFALRAGLDVIGVTTSPGNVPTQVATENTLRLLECFRRPEIRVAPGRELPLIYDPSAIRAFYDTAGKTEIAKRIWAQADIAQPALQPSKLKAHELIIESARQHPGEVILIMCAAPINLALAILVEPQVVDWLAGAVYLGLMITDPNLQLHTLDRPPRFMNDSYDSDALEIVVRSGLPVTFITSDAAFQVPLLSADDLDRIARVDHPINQCLAKMLRPWIAFVSERYQMQGCGMPDLLAVAAAIDPSVINKQPYHIDMAKHRIEDESKRYPYLHPDPIQGELTVVCAYEADTSSFSQLFWDTMTGP